MSRRTGRPSGRPAFNFPPEVEEVRTLARIVRKIAIAASGCWEWQAARDLNGYGRVGYRRDGEWRDGKAHRVLYEIVNGRVDEKLDLDHLCRNPCCVNPEHLEPVTHAENIRRGYEAKPRTPATHCSNGHEYTEENTALRSDGARCCRTCRRATVARWREENRELVRALDREAKRRESDRAGKPARWPGRVRPIRTKPVPLGESESLPAPSGDSDSPSVTLQLFEVA